MVLFRHYHVGDALQGFCSFMRHRKIADPGRGPEIKWMNWEKTRQREQGAKAAGLERVQDWDMNLLVPLTPSLNPCSLQVL